MKKYLSSFILLICAFAGSAVCLGSSYDDDILYVPSKIKYWFDNQKESKTQSIVGKEYSIDVSDIDDGFHTLSCQIICTDGCLGPSSNTYFLRVRTNEGTGYVPDTIMYWYDTKAVIYHTPYKENCTIDASMLDDGFHVLCYQLSDDKGHLSPVSSSFFLRVRTNEGTGYVPDTIMYWYDTKAVIYRTPYKENCTIDASMLDDGFHVLCYQLSDDKGHLSPVTSSFFLCVRTNGESGFSPKSIRYWFDSGVDVFTIDYAEASSIDATLLDEGFHTLCYQLADEDGNLSPVRTNLFLRMRTTEENNYTPTGIRYWFDTETEARQLSYQDNYMIDTPMLDDGFHVFCCQLTDSLGHMSPVRTTYFLRPTNIEAEYGLPETIVYWIDDNSMQQKSIPYSNGIILHELEEIPEGEHTINYQVITTNGVRTPARHCTFSRVFYDLYIKNPQEFYPEINDSIPVLAERPFIKLYYDKDTLQNVGHLHVDPLTTVSMGKFTQAFHLGYYNATNTKKELNYSRHTTLVNEGKMRSDSVIVELSAYKDRWHFFSLPFNVRVSDIQTAPGVYWTIREYDGEARAQGNKEATWKTLTSESVLDANRGYILQFTKAGTNRYDDYVSTFVMHALNDTKKNQIFASEDCAIALREHMAEFAHNRSWNLVGNPYPSFYDTRLLSLANPITVWTGTTYKAVSPEDDAYILAPFEAFFTQRPIGEEALTFRKEGRQDNPQARENPALAPSRASSRTLRQVYNLALSDTMVCDETRIVINEAAQASYEVERDAEKFMSTNEAVPQLFSEYDGVQYAINERPLANGTVALTLRIPQTDDYTLSLSSVRNAQLPIYLCDQWKNEVRRLDEESYTFSANEGMVSGRFILSFGEVSDLASVQEQLHGRIEVFDLTGRSCYRGRKSLSELRLLPGIYVVRSKESSHRIIIK